MTTATEKSFVDKMMAEGWQVSHYGLPDFLCARDNEIIFVEVKRNHNERLRDSQMATIAILEKLAPYFIWSPANPQLEPITDYLTKLRTKKRHIQSADHHERRKLATPQFVRRLVEEERYSIKQAAIYCGFTDPTIRKRLKAAFYAINGRKGG